MVRRAWIFDLAQAGTTHITDQLRCSRAAERLTKKFVCEATTAVLYIVAVNPNNVTGVLTLQKYQPWRRRKGINSTKALNTVGFYQALITHFILEGNIYCYNY